MQDITNSVFKPLTEEEIEEVYKFFSDVDDVKVLDELKIPKIIQNYGRLKSKGRKIEKAEEYLKLCKFRREETYKEKKEREIENWLFDYENEHSERGNYEFVRMNHRQWYRTMVISILSTQRWWGLKNNNTIEINEELNPDYFQECIQKYKQPF